MPSPLDEQITRLQRAGFQVTVEAEGTQRYVLVREATIPSLPWRDPRATLLVAIPAAFPSAGLDGFSIAAPCLLAEGGTYPRFSGEHTILGRRWHQVSWHYPDGKGWNPSLDDLETHLYHCLGFFRGRGIRS